MRNYQKLYYKNYFAENQNGEYIPVAHRECFAPGTPTTPCNPYPQRWFYDPEAGYAVRLARTKENDTLGKRNAADLKFEERYQNKKFQCIWKDTKHCDQNCEICNRKNKSQTVELDKTGINEAGYIENHFDLSDDSADIEAIIEDSELLNILFVELDRLSADDRVLWHFLKDKLKKQEIADKFNITIDGVRYREQQLYKKLRSNKTLRIFLQD